MSTQGNLFSTGYKSFLTNGSSNSTNGSGVTTLNGLNDVTLNSSQNQDVLMFNSTTTQWENHAIEDVVRGIGPDSIVVGTSASASTGNLAITVGSNSSASGEMSVNLGAYSSANGFCSVSLGSATVSSAERSLSVGPGAIATSQYSSSLGAFTSCQNSDYSLSVGWGSTCSNAQSAIAIGGGFSQASNAINVGLSSIGTHANSISLGTNSVSRTVNGVQFGANNNSGTATMHFRSQKVCDEAYADGNNRLATIDSSGNIVKSTIDPASLGGSTTVFNDDVFRIRDNVDNTKNVAFEVGNVGTGVTRTLNVPNLNGELCLTSGSQVVNDKILIDSTTFIADNLDNTKRLQFECSSLPTATNRILTVPDLTGTIALTSGPQIFTNKTLTAPIISSIVNTGTLTLPTSTDTLISRNTVDILTNKTIIATSNNVACNSLKTTTGVVTVASAVPPTAGQVLTAIDATTANWSSPSGGGTTFNDDVFIVRDNIDNTKRLQFQCSSIATGTIRTATVPDVNGVLCINNATGTGALTIAGVGGSFASGTNSTALGYSSVANQAGATALGNASLASGLRSISIGNSSSSPYTDGIAVGTSCRNEGDNSITIGANCLNTGYNSIVLGAGITNSTSNVLSIKVGAGGTLTTDLNRNNTTGTALPANVDWLTVTIGGVVRKIPLYN